MNKNYILRQAVTSANIVLVVLSIVGVVFSPYSLFLLAVPAIWAALGAYYLANSRNKRQTIYSTALNSYRRIVGEESRKDAKILLGKIWKHEQIFDRANSTHICQPCQIRSNIIMEIKSFNKNGLEETDVSDIVSTRAKYNL